MPEWGDIELTWADLAVLPARWRSALAQWRGIYYLQRVSPDMDAADIIALEGSWKQRLHTRQPHGLNDN
jgi:hypothetical protein